ncbi:5-oxoprolinase subunit C family protein [Psychroserpens luteolus]|uniref:5-oxoprolinase subunit C family protein n=1 Tax=Psychroserpens luteolus TaxID=2855840 RepID=UPI001E636197|nr:biotin-dependent carboxyltransferase family protein [Psychroserpens luteolus]MCD2259113.1 biotin-dependent carboxyltransferase family protein [Psychroserpens luteolus]
MIELLKAGLLDTIQDSGRMGFQEFGIPFSGAMDNYSYTLANSILGNPSDAAVIESTIVGPKLKFHADTSICITGAQMQPAINGNPVRNNIEISVKVNDVLSFGKREYGCRTYIAVAGGFQTKMVMNSRSMYKGITDDVRLKKGDVLPIVGRNYVDSKMFSSIKIDTTHFYKHSIEVTIGPEYEKLDTHLKELLVNQEFTISMNSNRMAYQFNETLHNSLDGIITSLVLPGTVQLTPSGQLMVLMRDCQVTGGYPRILQLTEASIHVLSQKFLGDMIRFKCIN